MMPNQGLQEQGVFYQIKISIHSYAGNRSTSEKISFVEKVKQKFRHKECNFKFNNFHIKTQ